MKQASKKILFIIWLLISFSCTHNQNAQSLLSPEFNNIDRHPKLSVEFLLGQYQASNSELFVSVPDSYCLFGEQYLQTKAYDAYIAMYNAALKEGIELKILSSFRSYFTQTWLWEMNWNKERNRFNTDVECTQSILHFLAMPGTSRHHWGTEIDFLSVSPNYFTQGYGKKVYDWLQNNAHEYGFYQAYTPINSARPVGYNEEAWHWSYAPLSIGILQSYVQQLSNTDLGEFNGAQTADELQVISKYVLGVNPKLLPK